MGEFLVGHFSFTSSIFLSLIKNWSATAMWIYYWGHYSPLTDNWMVHTTLFSLGAMPSFVWLWSVCVCVNMRARVCVWARKRRWKERVKTGWLDGLTEAFFLLYYKSIYHSLSPLFFQAITPSHSSSPVTVYGHMWWICYWNIMQSI